MHVIIDSQGSLLKCAVSGFGRNGGGGRRGNVTRFTNQSRKRMLETVSRLRLPKGRNRRHIASFITLTYGQEFPSLLESSQHIDLFMRRVLRLCPDAAIIWRKEVQARGAPHFHLMIFNLPYWSKSSVAAAWLQIISRKYADNSSGVPVAPFTRIESIKSKRHALFYIAKYMGKRVEPPQSQACGAEGGGGFNYGAYLDADGDEMSCHSSTGRWWGVRNRAKLPLDVRTMRVFGLDAKYADLKYLASLEWEGVDVDRLTGFTLFYDDPLELVKQIYRV